MKKRKKKQLKTIQNLHCPYCKAKTVIRSASEIYHDPTAAGELYVCSNYPKCNAFVGIHAGTRKPLGTLADGDLRSLRIKTHRKFDRIWQTGIMNRRSAYRWMAEYFGLSVEDAHIGMFDIYRCEALMKECSRILENCCKAAG